MMPALATSTAAVSVPLDDALPDALDGCRLSPLSPFGLLIEAGVPIRWAICRPTSCIGSCGPIGWWPSAASIR